MSRSLTSAAFILLVLGGSVFSQHDKKGCHVYVVDVAMAKKLGDLTDLTEAQEKECEKKPAKCGLVEFPVFQPMMEEEELTTKTYKFPWAPLTITATIFTTDESWLGDSAILTITLSGTSPKNGQADANSAQAEIVLFEKYNAAKVKRYYRVKNKQYLVGLECLFSDLPEDAPELLGFRNFPPRPSVMYIFE